MLLLVASVAAAAALGLAVFKPKTFWYMVRYLRYETMFQIVGTRAIIEDHRMRSRNKLDEIPDRKGQVAVITGGARGIGVEVIKVLLAAGMKVVMGVRKPEAARKIFPDIAVVIYELDVSSLKSVEKFAKKVSEGFPEINLLINNAGIMLVPEAATVDGFESQMGTNYMGHFLLGHLLMPNLDKAGKKTETCSRIVNVSSSAHYPGKIYFEDINMKDVGYISSAAYAQSKLAQLMYAKYLNAKLEEDKIRVKVYSVHPGVVNTELFDNTPFAKMPWFMNLFFKTPEQGAVSILHTCFSPKIENKGGLYISNCREGLQSAYSKKTENYKKLFDLSCKLTGIKQYGVV